MLIQVYLMTETITTVGVMHRETGPACIHPFVVHGLTRLSLTTGGGPSPALPSCHGGRRDDGQPMWLTGQTP